MSKDLIRYDLMVQDALKSVLRKLLVEAARDGLPGDHHFYITFRTEAPGVRLSQRMREKYPEEMTVVLQHQFWDLGVTEHAFEVGLSFGGIPERLLVPFDSISGFFDPSVKFGLKFELQDDNAALPAEEASAPPRRPQLTAVPSGPQPEAGETQETLPLRKSTPRSGKASLKAAGAMADEEAAPDMPGRKTPAKPAGPDSSAAGQNQAGTSRETPDQETPGKDKADKDKPGKQPPAKENGAQIVSLDAFRKKT